MKNNLTLGSLFDGSGGFSLGGLQCGITPVWASEIEPFPIRVTTKRLPFVKHYGDITKLNGAEIEPVDIITFGSPCFPAGTLILTDKGYTEIQNIKIGDVVLTHKGRWKRVTDVGSKSEKTVVLKGNYYGLECTPNHPIYSYSNNKIEWTKAEDMLGKHWATPCSADCLPIPIPKTTNKRYKPFPELSERFFYFVGRWLGDGWVRDSQRPGRPFGQKFSTILICDSKDKLQELIDTVSCISDRYSVEEKDNCCKIKCNGRLLCDWLSENFGKYSYGKEIPAWVFSMPANYRTALLNGISDSDGYKHNNRHRITTVSKKLALGIRMLGESLGYSTAVFFQKSPSKCVIEGRTVNQRDYYVVELCNKKRSMHRDNLHGWYPVKSITETEQIKTVYNFTVEDDNSYIADGIVVHNCQDMSVAGKRAGLDGSRSNLFYEAVRIIKEMRCKTDGKYPRYIVWENVPGAFSSNKGEDFRCVLEEIAKIKDGKADIPRYEKWPNAGYIMADDYSVAWRVFDAQFWGVPQRRKRIYLVADFAGGSAAKILFESEGLPGYPQKGGFPWQRTAENTPNGSGEASTVCLNDQGGNRMDVTADKTTTLRAEAHHPPCVIDAAGFCTEHSANSRSIGFEKDVSPTLRAGAVPATVYENHGQDTRYKGPLNTAPTVNATYGTGGNNQPFVVENTKCYDVRFTSEGTKNARQNCYETDTARTIDTGGNAPDSNQGGVAVVYGICSAGSNSMKSDNPHSGIYKADTSRCLDANGGNPSCNQGGMAVCVQGSMIGRKDENGPNGNGTNVDVSFTLNATDKHAVAYGIDRAAFNQGKNALYNFAVEKELEPTIVAKGPGAVAMPTYSSSKASFFTNAETELANTLVATDYKDPPMINDTNDNAEYIVRRLTPTECARLQGFPDWWCSDLETENPTTEDIRFWYDVFETHRNAVNPNKKPKSIKQVIKWLKNPHSDSAEYKMWGNGVALPCVCFVLAGIVWANEKYSE